MKARFAKEHLIPLGWIVLFAAIFTLPMLINGFWPFFWGARLAENWHYHFSQQFWHGELYPRWLTGMNEGLGSPVFFYYPPLPYWITSLLGPLVPNDPVGWRALGVSAFVSLALSGFGTFLWLRQMTRRTPALVAAILYMLMPYHLAKDLYYHGVFAEYWAFTWLPFVLLGVQQVFGDNRFAVLGLAWSYAALITTHLPTTLIFSPFVIFYAVFLWRSSRCGRAALGTGLGMALGTGLAAIYLIPALTMQGHTAMEALRYFYYANSFFFTDFNFTTFNLGGEYKEWLLLLVAATLAIALCAAFITDHSSPDLDRRHTYFWAGVMLFAFFMMLPVSNLIWKLFPVLQVIQFPWRFNAVLCIAAAALIGLGINHLKRPLGIRNLLLLQIGYASIVVWLYATALPLFRHHIFPTETAPTGTVNTLDAPEYRPKNVKTSREAAIEKYGGAGKERGLIESGTAKVKTLSASARRLSFTVSARESTALLVRQFYYYGWTAFVDGKQTSAKPSSPEGMIQVDMPAGKHEVIVALLALGPEKLGRAISGTSVLISLVLLTRYSVLAKAKPYRKT